MDECRCIGYVYKISNNRDEKIYIGQTVTTANERFEKHCHAAYETLDKHLKNKLYKCMREYGKDAFRVETVESIEADSLIPLWRKLLPQEAYWINYHDSINNGYNTQPGFIYKKDIDSYIKRNLVNRVFTSNVCPWRFSSFYDLALHKYKFHGGDLPLCCGYCTLKDFRCVTKKELKDHISEKHKTNDMQMTEFCNSCDFVTDNNATLRIHITTCHSENWILSNTFERKRKKPDKFLTGLVCKKCQYSSDDHKKISNHVDKNHSLDEIVPIDGTRDEKEPQHVCKWRLCGQVIKEQNHENIRHGEYHPCGFCKMTFLFRCLLEKHIKILN
jgi:hypothetical protein